MAFKIQKVQYFYAAVKDQPGAAYKILSILSKIGVNLLAFNAIPTGPDNTQLTLFPEYADVLIKEANRSGLTINGPHPAILVQGDDELGALSSVHDRLYRANVNVFASSGVADGSGSYGYVIYVRPEDLDNAISALEL